MDFSRPAFNQRIHIRNGRVIDPRHGLDRITDLYVADGLIVALGNAPVGFRADVEFDATGMLVMPGAVDLCARVREPGQTQKGTIHSETRAAAAGGITHLCCPPDTRPVIDTRAVAALIQERAHQSGYAHVLPIGALTKGLQGQHLAEMHALKEAGCVGVSQLRSPVKDSLTLLRCLEYASTFDLTVFFQSEEASLSPKGGMHAGATATRLGLPAIADAAETVALSRDLLLVQQAGVRAHFGQLSCARSVELIAAAQREDLQVTADVAVHQLFLTDTLIDGFNSQYHTRPPLRSEQDRLALIAGLQSGVISVLSSDHQPHEAAAKSEPFPSTEPGISAFATFLPLSYRLVRDGVLTDMDWVRRVATQPAALVGLDAGHLETGSNANLCVFDPGKRWKLTEHSILSQGKNTPFLGQMLQGQVRLTLKDGAISFRN